MTSLFEVLPYLVPYKPALLAFAILCLTVPLQGFLSAPLSFAGNEQVPGMPLKGDHSNLSFRALRTYANATENLPGFGFALLLAIVAGASAGLVNWLAVIHVGFRLTFWAVYYSGIGKPAGGPRTLVYVGALLTNIALAATSVIAMVSA